MLFFFASFPNFFFSLRYYTRTQGIMAGAANAGGSPCPCAELSHAVQNSGSLFERVIELEKRMKTLEHAHSSTGDSNSGATVQPRTYQRTPCAHSAVQLSYVPCSHGIETEPWLPTVCALCATPWAGSYKCDGCGREGGYGVRYACTVCDNYDLCQSCNDADTHSHHVMTQIKHNQQEYGNSHPAAGHRSQPICPSAGVRAVEATAYVAQRSFAR